MVGWLQHHHVIETLVIYWVFNAAVSSMPVPQGKGFYYWLYGFTHGLLQFAAANIDKIPGVKQYLSNGKAETPKEEPK